MKKEQINNLVLEPELTDQEVIAQSHHLEMMRRPHLWPRDPLLPLRHQSQRLGGWPRLAVLVHLSVEKGHFLFMPDVNLLSLPDKFWQDSQAKGFQEGGPELLARIFLEGWEVD